MGVGFPVYQNVVQKGYIKISLEDGEISEDERAYPIHKDCYKILYEISNSKFSSLGEEILRRDKDELKQFLKQYIYNHFNQEIIN